MAKIIQWKCYSLSFINTQEIKDTFVFFSAFKKNLSLATYLLQWCLILHEDIFKYTIWIPISFNNNISMRTCSCTAEFDWSAFCFFFRKLAGDPPSELDGAFLLLVFIICRTWEFSGRSTSRAINISALLFGSFLLAFISSSVLDFSRPTLPPKLTTCKKHEKYKYQRGLKSVLV